TPALNLTFLLALVEILDHDLASIQNFEFQFSFIYTVSTNTVDVHTCFDPFILEHIYLRTLGSASGNNVGARNCFLVASAAREFKLRAFEISLKLIHGFRINVEVAQFFNIAHEVDRFYQKFTLCTGADNGMHFTIGTS